MRNVTTCNIAQKRRPKNRNFPQVWDTLGDKLGDVSGWPINQGLLVLTTPAIALIRLMKRPRRKVSGFFHAYFPDLTKQNGQKKRVWLFRPSEHCCSSLGLIDRIAGFVVSRSLDCGLFFHFTSHFASALGKRFGHTGRGGRSLRAEEVKDGDYRKEHGTGGR